MKRKLSLLLAMVLAMTMVMGIGVTAFAGTYDVVAEIDIPTHVGSTIPDPRVAESYSSPGGLNFKSGMSPTFAWCIEDPEGEGQVGGTKYKYVGGPVDTSKEYSYIFAFVINTDSPTLSVCINGKPYTAYNNMNYGGDFYLYCGIIPLGKIDDEGNIIPPGGSGSDPTPEKPSSPAHVHNFQWQTITAPTQYADGLEGEVCSCGATRNTQPISAMDYAINKYADQMIKAAKPGQKITLEFGEFNSFPRYMMEKVAARMNDNITFVFKFKQNKKMQTVTIGPGTAIDLQYDWYGPDKMKELYGAE